MALPYLACMLWVARMDALPPRVLPAIQAVEGGSPGAVRHDADGSEDLGVMQINSHWLPLLAQATGRDAGALRAALLSDACFNIAVAGAIVREDLRQARGDLLAAVGNYHSRTPALHLQYREKVLEAARRLFTTPH